MADTTPPPGLLRPLGFGEIFDRAVTLYIRNFVAFSGIVLVLLVPWGFIQYFIDAGQSNQFSVLIDAIKHAKADPIASHLPASYYVIVFGSLAIFVILAPFALNAVAIGVARIYTGATIGFRDCYVASLRKFWPVVGLIVMWGFIASAVYGAFAIVIAIFFVIGFATLASVKAAGILFMVIGALVALAMLATLMTVGIAMTFAMYGVVIERRGVFDSIGAGFIRVFSRVELGRAMLFGLCAGVIYVAAAAAASGFSVLALVVHQTWLMVLVSTAANTVIYAFTVVLFAVYYYDVRIRREGLDVEAGLQSLVAPTTA